MADKESRRRRRRRGAPEEEELEAQGTGARPPQEVGRQVYPPVEGQPSPREQPAPPGQPSPAAPQPRATAPARAQAPDAGAERQVSPQPAAQPAPPAQIPSAPPAQPAPQQQPRPESRPQPQEPAPAPAPAQPPEYQQGYFYPPPWYPPPYPPPGYYYPGFGPPQMPQVPAQQPSGQEYFAPGAPPPPEQSYPGVQTGQMPVVPPQAMIPPVQPMMPGPPPGFPPVGLQTGEVPMYPPGAVAPFPPQLMLPAEEAEFEALTEEEPGRWRKDVKWIFGVLTAVFLFMTLTAAGFYRTTGSGAARDIMVPLIGHATGVKEAVKDNYQELRSKARRTPGAKIPIPDIGVEVTISANDINSLTSDDLADKVILEIERKVYQSGYAGNLPLDDARGVGEERAKAISGTFLSLLNRRTHRNLLWPVIILGGLSLAFGVLFVVFCRGWGRVTGAGIVVISAALPGSLFIRVGSEFVWKSTSSGTFKGASAAALGGAGSLMLAFFDVALGLGALALLVGVVGSIISRRARERVPPFLELKRPEETVAGGPSVQAGLEKPEVEDDQNKNP